MGENQRARIQVTPGYIGATMREMLGGDTAYVHCRHCNSDEVSRSRTRGIESWLSIFGRRPYRCLVCSRRFFGPTGLKIKTEEKEKWWE